MLELTSVLPTPTSGPQSRWPPNRWATAAASMWLAFRSPAPGVTTPCRSASGSFAKATSKSAAMSRRRAIAYGEEQSMRILPSQSSGTNRKVGSSSSETTVMSRPWRSAIACQ